MLAAISFAAFAVHGQVYKMDRVWRSGRQELISKVDVDDPDSRTFLLYESKYYDSEKAYTNQFLSIYFEGDIVEMNRLLSGIIAFMDEYSGQTDIYIEVEDFKAYKDGRIIYIFDQDGRHMGRFAERDIRRMNLDFLDYCKKENISLD